MSQPPPFLFAGESRGRPGLDGSNVLPTDEAISQAIDTPGSATSDSLLAAIAGEAVSLDVGEYPVGAPSGTDDTATINGIITAALAAGRKKIVLNFESGEYLINGALVTTGNRNAQIPMPIVPTSSPKVTIVFRCPSGYDGAMKSLGNQSVLPVGGAILRSNLNVGAFSSATGVASVIGGPAYGAAALEDTIQAGGTNVKVIFDGVCVRQQNDPTAVSIDLSHCAQTEGQVVVDTAAPFTDLGPCTNPQAAGVIMPQEFVANGWSALDVWAVGYFVGWVPGECTSTQRVTAAFNNLGQACQSNTHVAHIDYCLMTNNVYHLAGWDPATGVTDVGDGHSDNPSYLQQNKCFMSIGTLDIEHAADPHATILDIKDASNQLHLVANWAVFAPGPLLATGTNKCSLTSINADFASPGQLIYDKATNRTDLNPATDGHHWVVQGGAWDADANGLFGTATGINVLVRQTAWTNGRVGARIGTGTGATDNWGLVARCTSSIDFLFLFPQDGIYKCINDTFTLLHADLGYSNVVGDLWELEFRGPRLIAYKNGAMQAEVYDESILAPGGVGLRTFDSDGSHFVDFCASNAF